MICPSCKQNVRRDSERAICVELFGECLGCRRTKISSSDIQRILSVKKDRTSREGRANVAD